MIDQKAMAGCAERVRTQIENARKTAEAFDPHGAKNIGADAYECAKNIDVLLAEVARLRRFALLMQGTLGGLADAAKAALEGDTELGDRFTDAVVGGALDVLKADDEAEPADSDRPTERPKADEPEAEAVPPSHVVEKPAEPTEKQIDMFGPKPEAKPTMLPPAPVVAPPEALPEAVQASEETQIRIVHWNPPDAYIRSLPYDEEWIKGQLVIFKQEHANSEALYSRPSKVFSTWLKKRDDAKDHAKDKPAA